MRLEGQGRGQPAKARPRIWVRAGRRRRPSQVTRGGSAGDGGTDKSWPGRLPSPLPSHPQWAGVLSRLALEQERILNPLLDRVRTADHHQLRSLTGLIRNLSRNARNKDEMCEWGRRPICPHPAGLRADTCTSWAGLWEAALGKPVGGGGDRSAKVAGSAGGGWLPNLPTSRQPPRW